MIKYLKKIFKKKQVYARIGDKVFFSAADETWRSGKIIEFDSKNRAVVHFFEGGQLKGKRLPVESLHREIPAEIPGKQFILSGKLICMIAVLMLLGLMLLHDIYVRYSFGMEAQLRCEINKSSWFWFLNENCSYYITFWMALHESVSSVVVLWVETVGHSISTFAYSTGFIGMIFLTGSIWLGSSFIKEFISTIVYRYFFL